MSIFAKRRMDNESALGPESAADQVNELSRAVSKKHFLRVQSVPARQSLSQNASSEIRIV
jgi:hypothetical protein